jgi:transposase
MALKVRVMTEEERAELRRRAQSRTAPARVVERARLVLGIEAGETAPAVAERLGLGADVVRGWLKRFNAEGLAGLEDRPCSG